MAQSSKPQHAYPANHRPGHQPRRALTRLLCVLLALQPMLAQAAPALAQSTTLEAPEGKVSLLAKTDTDYTQKKRREADLLWWNERDRGQVKETVRPVEIEAGGGLRIHAGRGVVIEYYKTGDLRASLGQLAEAPGLKWIAPLQADPRVDWRGVEAAFREWGYAQSGLTEAGAALVALVTAVATGGIDFSQLLTSGALSGVKATAFNAGMQALTVKASVALVNNKGDLAATLKQLAATDTLRALATAMVTAGLTAHLEQAAGLGGELTRTAQYMERGLIRATVRAGVGTALQGGSLDENFIRALRLEAASTLGEVTAQKIGAEVDANDLGTASRLIAHAALGCVVGAVAADECGSGAVGGVTGEAIGLMTRARLAEWLETRIRDARAGKVTPARILEELKAYQESGINVARLASGLAVAAAGGDVDTAAFAGGNAAEHNALCGGLCIGFVAALIGYVSYSGDGDLGEGLAAIGAGQDPLSRAVSAGAARSVEWSSSRYPDITAAVLGALEATGGAIEATITYLDDKTGQQVSRRWNELPEHTRNQIKGGSIVASFLLPAASVGKLGQYAKTGKLPDSGITKGIAGVPGRVQSRINLQTGSNNFGMKHILKEHLSGKANKSQFNMGEADLRSLLQSKQVVNSPIVKTLQSDIHGTLYVRQIDVGRIIGTNYLKNNNPTSVLTIQSDKFGNIVTAFPGM